MGLVSAIAALTESVVLDATVFGVAEVVSVGLVGLVVPRTSLPTMPPTKFMPTLFCFGADESMKNPNKTTATLPPTTVNIFRLSGTLEPFCSLRLERMSFQRVMVSRQRVRLSCRLRLAGGAGAVSASLLVNLEELICQVGSNVADLLKIQQMRSSS